MCPNAIINAIQHGLAPTFARAAVAGQPSVEPGFRHPEAMPKFCEAAQDATQSNRGGGRSTWFPAPRGHARMLQQRPEPCTAAQLRRRRRSGHAAWPQRQVTAWQGLYVWDFRILTRPCVAARAQAERAQVAVPGDVAAEPYQRCLKPHRVINILIGVLIPALHKQLGDRRPR